MRSLCSLWLAWALACLAGCAHQTSNTNQFYLAQNYLPVPRDWIPPPGWDLRGERITNAPPSRTNVACISEGPIFAGPITDSEDLTGTKLWPGMTLRVTQTTYSETNPHAAPVLSAWAWLLPASAECSDGRGIVIPHWQRQDLLVARQLLSGAQLWNQGEPEVPGPEYFSQAMKRSCKENRDERAIEGLGELSCALDSFVSGLSLDVRANGLEFKSAGPSGPLDVQLPKQVLASDPERLALIARSHGLGTWYSRLWRPLPGDLFLTQADVCSKGFSDATKKGTGRREQVKPQDTELCTFAFASLDWKRPRDGVQMAGAQEMLHLLRSGDPLLLFQPETYRLPLDTGNAKHNCDGDPACPMAKRMARGFVDISLTVPVQISGKEPRVVQLPVGTTIDDLRRNFGWNVVAFRRSIDWLPKSIELIDKVIAAVDVKDSSGRVTLVVGKTKFGLGKYIEVTEHSDDLLVAPGDILILREK